MKYLAVALSAIGLSSTAFAALPATTDPTLIAIPQLPGGFVIGVSGYYLEPSYTHGDLDFATNVFGSRIKAVEPGFDWGWGVNAGYIFPNTGNDVNLNYFHLNANGRNSFFPGTPFNFQFITADIFVPDNINNTINAYISSATVQYDIDRVDLLAGQFIDVGCRLTLHPSVGVSYLSLDRKLNSLYQGTVSGFFAAGVPETLRDQTAIREKSEYDGIGPLANIDANYYLGLGFGLVAHADAGFYIGDTDVTTNALRNVNDTIVTLAETIFTSATIDNSFPVNSNRRIVPVTDVKVGANYTYLFNNAANSDLTLEVGYQVSHYYNPVDRLSGFLSNALVSTTGRAFNISAPVITGHTASDVGLNGPYVNLTLHI